MSFQLCSRTRSLPFFLVFSPIPLPATDELSRHSHRRMRKNNPTHLKNSLGLGQRQGGFRCYFLQLSNNINCAETSKLDQEGDSLTSHMRAFGWSETVHVFPSLQGHDQFLASKPKRDVGIWWELQRLSTKMKGSRLFQPRRGCRMA